MENKYNVLRWVVGGMITVALTATVFSGCGGECPLKKNGGLAPATEKSKTTDEGETWMTDFELAKSQAKISNKPILLSFSGSDWCGWCIKLDNEVFSQPEFVNWAKDNAILVTADFPRAKEQDAKVKAQNAALAQEFGVNGFPTVVVLNSNGQEIARTGYQPGGAEKYVNHLKGLIK